MGIFIISALAWVLFVKKTPFSHIYSPFYKKDYTCKNCNVVILDIDVLRADALPCYGYHRNTAPNICSLAGKGVLFGRNYSQSHWTLPSIASTITSLYPSAHKTQLAFKDKISPEVITMAELFEQEGYNTIFVGPSFENINFYPIGIERGFNLMPSRLQVGDWLSVVDKAAQEESPFFIYFQTQWLNMPYILGEDIELLEPLSKPPGFPQTKKEYESLLGDYLVENYMQVFTEKAIKDYPELFENIGPERKYSLVELLGSSDAPSGLLVQEKWRPVYNSYFGHIEKGGKPAREYMRLMYDTSIALLDKEMQPLLNYLKQLDNVIVIIMSQHGEEFSEHGGFSHQTLYNEILNTPLIIKSPGFKSRRIEKVTQNIDILPTLMELIGASIPEQTQGKSLVSFLKEGRAPERYAVSERGYKIASIQNERWKLIAYRYLEQDPALELYDLAADPKEQTNLAYKNPEMAESLLSKLRTILEESRVKYQVTQPPFPEWIDEEKRERLIEQGYF